MSSGHVDVKIDASYAEKIVIIDYTNWRGQRAPRRIVPLGIVYGTTKWHPEPQWLLNAWDVVKKTERTFAMKDIHMWEPAYKT